MRALHLKEKVSIVFPNFFGKNTTISFSPITKKGWYWLPNKKESMVPIDYTIAVGAKNRIVLEYEGCRLNVYEHVAPLRFTGLDGVLVECNSSWAPHFGQTMGYWEKLKDHVFEADYNIPQKSHLDSWDNLSLVGEHTRGIRWTNNANFDSDSVLEIKAFVDYAGIGQSEKSILMTSEGFEKQDLEKIFLIPSQGFPRYRRPINKLFNLLNMGPLPGTVIWPQDYSCQQKVSDLFATHRVLDILGALALMSHNSLPSGKFESWRAGHSDDLKMLHDLGN